MWSPRQESNLYLALRRHLFYPLNYGEGRRRAQSIANRPLTKAAFEAGIARQRGGGWRATRLPSADGRISLHRSAARRALRRAQPVLRRHPLLS
ncbi:hypothetical protein BCAR13_310046 [Paraburkholderia caribensis]|nr:hypothetical protein BCAR13_310046 [Paraburkholderia caribensis]